VAFGTPAASEAAPSAFKRNFLQRYYIILRITPNSKLNREIIRGGSMSALGWLWRVLREFNPTYTRAQLASSGAWKSVMRIISAYLQHLGTKTKSAAAAIFFF